MAESGRPSQLAAREGRGFSPSLRDLSHIQPKPIAVRELPLTCGRQCERRDLAAREALRCRVRAEFDEMRGLRLSLPQASRLFGLRDDVCARILDGLAIEGFLRRSADGRYGRRDVA